MVHSGMSGEAGQILVTVALAILVLLLFVGLAVDVGNIYAERRAMQNAADAGALAGAREICLGNGEPAAIEIARQYAVDRNGADGDMTAISVNGNNVNVVAGEAANMFLIGLIGFPTVDVTAEAEAACGEADSACGLWPVAFDVDIWDEVVGGNPCESQPTFWVWDAFDIECFPLGPWDCEGFDFIPGERRAWVDFSAPLTMPDLCDNPGCGDKELGWRIGGYNDDGDACLSWVGFGESGGVCIVGSSSVRTDSWREASRHRGIARIPLYDPDRSGCTMESDPGNVCSSERYWIVGYGCVEVVDSKILECVELPCPGPKPKAIKVTVSCDAECNAECGTTAGTPVPPGGVGAVSLVK